MRWSGAVKPLVFGLVLVVVGKLLERRGVPAQGRIGGLVPYDLRPPTLDRVRAAFWDPSSGSVLAPTAFGVGFGINFGAVARRLGLA